MTSFYDLDVKSLNGAPGRLAGYRGNVSLVVNLASQCGLTPQYAELEALHRELGGRGFTVLGFPSNDFGGQEPGTPDEIAAFCQRTYDITFPMFEKVVTKAGATQSPVYAFLGETGHLPKWNFAKYLVDRNGQVVQFFDSRVTPADPQLRAAIEKTLD
jgi:glutathione peroxidase